MVASKSSGALIDERIGTVISDGYHMRGRRATGTAAAGAAGAATTTTASPASDMPAANMVSNFPAAIGAGLAPGWRGETIA